MIIIILLIIALGLVIHHQDPRRQCHHQYPHHQRGQSIPFDITEHYEQLPLPPSVP